MSDILLTFYNSYLEREDGKIVKERFPVQQYKHIRHDEVELRNWSS
ncbi:MAG: hypothetical protein RMK80_06975 [Pseudobdellovibrionaceae bacterium]|nr:hypothetical protein [Pseudobdellovibrionaceae bacterium]